MAGAALRARGRTLAWQMRHFDSLGIAGARLGAAGAWLLLRGRRKTGCFWINFCVAGAGFCHKDVHLLSRRSTLTLWALPVPAWGPLGPGCFCMASARLSASEATFAWQVQHFLTWTCICVAGAALSFSGPCRCALGRRWGPAGFAWQAQEFLHLKQLSRGRSSNLCTWTCICVASAAR